jgi:hypothetical protein
MRDLPCHLNFLPLEPMNLEWSADVRFGAHNWLKSDVALCPKSSQAV